MARKQTGYDRAKAPPWLQKRRGGLSVVALACCVLSVSLTASLSVQAAPLIQSVFRVYSPSSTVTPGSALGSTDSSVVLPGIASQFRVRAGLTNPSTSSQLGLTQISGGGYNHMCAMATNSKAYCWGNNEQGQLGDGTIINSSVPVEVLTTGALSGKTIKSISAGYYYTCAIANDDKAYCWGDNAEGQLGDGTRTDSSTPVAVLTSGVLSGKTIKALSTGNLSTCAIASDDLAYCWGANTNGQIGDGSVTRRPSPVAVSTGSSSALNGKTVKAIASSYRHVCVIASDDLVYCWGNGGNGRLGNNSIANSSYAVAVSTTSPSALNGKTVKEISAGGSHTCAVASDDKPYCWGAGTRGQLGDGSDVDFWVPVGVSTSGVLSGLNIERIGTGSTHSCARANDGQAYCWGNGGFGMLGDGTSVEKQVPVAVVTSGVLSGKTLIMITVSHSSVCVIASDNNAYCWGNGEVGQVGNNTFTITNTEPVAVDGSSVWSVGPVSVAASSTELQLEYAYKASYSTCSVVPSVSWSPVTSVSAISFDDVSPNDNQAISPFAEDPSVPTISSGFNYQSIVRGTTSSAHSFTNSNEITAGQTGLWDFVLRDRTASSNSSYCLRIVTPSGSSSNHTVDEYSAYPELTTATGSLDIRFIDNSDNSISDPTIAFTSLMSQSSSQTSSAVLLDSSSRRLEIANSSSNTGWSVTLAATAGPSATWLSGSDSYLYNGTTTTGQLSIDTSGSSFGTSGTTPAGTACGTTGLSIGSSASYDGSTSSLTLASGSSASGFNCIFTLRSVNLYQSVPADQAGGTYTLPMTVTVMAQ